MSSQIVTDEVARLTKEGWQVISETSAGIQVRKPKQWNTTLLVVLVLFPAIGGLFWLPLFGVAVVGLVIAVALYFSQPEELRLLTPESVLAHQAAKEEAGEEPRLMPILAIVAVVFLLLMGFNLLT